MGSPLEQVDADTQPLQFWREVLDLGELVVVEGQGLEVLHRRDDLVDGLRRVGRWGQAGQAGWVKSLAASLSPLCVEGHGPEVPKGRNGL